MILLLNLAVFALILIAVYTAGRWWRRRRALQLFNEAQKNISSYTMTEGMFQPTSCTIFLDGVAGGLMQKAEEPFPATLYVPAMDGTTTTYTCVKSVHGKYGSFALYSERSRYRWSGGGMLE